MAWLLQCCTDPRFELRNAEKLQIVVSGLREAVQPTPPLVFSRNLRKNEMSLHVDTVNACHRK